MKWPSTALAVRGYTVLHEGTFPAALLFDLCTTLFLLVLTNGVSRAR